MNKKIKRIIIMVVFFIIALVINSKVKAATIISFSPENPKVGDTVKVTISIANVNTATITANVSGAVSGSIRLVKGDLTGAAATFSETGSFTCTQEGKINVSISSDSSAVLNGNYVDVGGSASTTVEPKASETPSEPETPPAKSNNANLGNLGIRPNDFKGFKSGTTSYNVTVPNDVDKVEVYAVAKDSKATVSGTGNKSLNVGANALKVTVTAEDGTTKTYTINVTREEKTETTENTTSNEVTNEIANEVSNETSNETTNETVEGTVDYSEYDLQELEVEGYALTPKFKPDVYEYKLDIPSKDVTSLNIKTKGKNDKIKIEIDGNTDLKDGENIVTILVTNEVTGDNSTYQIIVNRNDLSETNNAIDANIAKANKVRAIIFGVIAFIVVAIIIFIIARYRINKKIEKENDKYEYDEDDKSFIDSKEEMPKALQKNVEEQEEKEEEKIEQEEQNMKTEETKFEEDDDYNRRNRKSGRGKHF